MNRLNAALVAFSSLVLACGTDGPDTAAPDACAGECRADAGADAPPACVATELAQFPDADFGAPGTIDRSGCEAGSLAGVDLTGLWWVVDQENQTSFANGPVRMELTCQGGFAARSGFSVTTTPWDLVSLSGDDLFLREESSGATWTQVEAYDFCAVAANGDLIGRAGQCVDFGGNKTCWEYDIRASRFGRIPGEGLAQGLELVGAFAGGNGAPWPEDFTANVDVYQGYAYVARGGDALRIVDVSNPEAPVEVGSFAASNESFNDVHIVAAAGSVYAILASSERGAVIVDVKDPSAPQHAVTLPLDPVIQGGAHRIGLEQRQDGSTRIYITNGSPYVGIWDVTQPESAMYLGRYRSPVSGARVHAASASADRLYVATTRDGLFVADITDPANPVPLGEFTEPGEYSHFAQPASAAGRSVVLHIDEGYGAHLEILDGDPASPEFMQLIGSLEFRPEASIHNLVIVGERAYIAHYQDGVRVVDFSDPTAPTLVGYYNTWDPDTAPGAFFEGAIDIEVDDDGLIYVADTPGGLFILREMVTDPG